MTEEELLSKGYKKVGEAVKGHHDPEPLVGDFLISSNKCLVEIEACTCICCKGQGWPLGNKCGAHIKGGFGIIYGSGIWFRNGALFRKTNIKLTKLNNVGCPLCGFSGDDIVFDFYCHNKNCRNYHKC